jgi:hypothetical protein
LTLSGASMLAATLPLDVIPAVAVPEALRGRVLTAAVVHSRPDDTAPVVGRLWPDVTTAIRESCDGWYAVEGGYVRRQDVQPMVAYAPGAGDVPALLPVWGQVIAPVMPIRAWASGRAPLVTRIGYGGVLFLRDTLVDDRGLRWYGVAADEFDRLLGWTAAPGWSAVELPAPASDPMRWVQLDRDRAVLRAWQGAYEVIRLPVTLPDSPPTADVYEISGRSPAFQAGDHCGAPWALMAGDLHLYGAYWHHAFGTTHPTDAGPGVSMMPWAARWLYAWLPDGARVQMSLR